MTRFLASVRDPAEAAIALAAGADIIDLKEPGTGALGAVAPATLKACVKAVAGRAPVSATIGDLPMEPSVIADAVLETAACGVDYVKLGIFPGGEARACLDRLATDASHIALVVVLFADAMPDFDAVSAAATAGAAGVMLDTARKDSGPLLDHMPLETIARFVEGARREGLIAGLAGSLRAADIAKLLPLQPDLLGFRSALCRGATRSAAIDPGACRLIRALIPAHAHKDAQMPAPLIASVC
jgi:dihydroneopterin aldolase